MSSVRRAIAIEGADPQAAYDLWIDTTRWPTFIDGFKHVERQDAEWPSEGAKLVWTSPPAGRGTVTERVVTNEPGRRFATRIFEERLTGVQTASFEEGGVVLELEYELQKGGPLRAVVDALFIRRAQSEALQRTLMRLRRELTEAL
jgi:uncharacterized membrane protein